MAALAIDLTQHSFGQWWVLGKGRQTGHGQFWICACQAGCVPTTQAELCEEGLVAGWTQSCGCDQRDSLGRRKKLRNPVGQQYGRYLVLRMQDGSTHKKRRCIVRCTCGTEKSLVLRNMLREGRQGCHQCQVARVFTKVQMHRWYQHWFVVQRLPSICLKGGLRASLFLCRCGGCGRQQPVRGTNLIRSLSTQCRACAQAQYGRLEGQADRVVALAAAGCGMAEIGRVVGCSRSAVSRFLRRHREYVALVAAFPVTEELIAEVS